MTKYNRGTKFVITKDEGEFVDLAVFMADAGDDLHWLCDSVDNARKSPYADASELLEDLLIEVKKIAKSLMPLD